MGVWLAIFHFGFITFHFRYTMAEFTGFRKYTDMRIIQGVALRNGVSSVECCSLCAKNTTCTSINYNYIESVCEINSLKLKSREFRLLPATGWNVLEKFPCGIGYKTGEHCHHIQNLFQDEPIRTYQEAVDFCHALGSTLATIENDKDKAELESDAELAEMYVNAYIWLHDKVGTSCKCFTRKNGDIVVRSCDLNAAVVCER